MHEIRKFQLVLSNIVVRSDLDFKLKSVEADNDRRYIIMAADVLSSYFLFVNIYAPNKVQECRFLDNLNKAIGNFVVNKENKIIIGGDFTVTLYSDLDCNGGNPSNKDSIKNIRAICRDFDLVGIWRIRNFVIPFTQDSSNHLIITFTR